MHSLRDSLRMEQRTRGSVLIPRVPSICSQQVSSHVRERSSFIVMMVPLKREGEEEEEGEPH